MLAPWLVGLDVGQVHDPAALAIALREMVIVMGEQQPRYLVRHLERFPLGMAYPKMVARVEALIAKLPMPQGWDVNPLMLPYRLIVDATGVGRPVVDMFRAVGCRPIAVTMTHGVRSVQHEWNDYTVPKRVLVAALVVAAQQQRFSIAKALDHAATLEKEIRNFRYKITKDATDQYGAWREGEHDDLVFAAGLIAWYGEAHKPAQRQLTTGGYAEGPGSPFDRMGTRTPERPSNPFAGVL